MSRLQNSVSLLFAGWAAEGNCWERQTVRGCFPSSVICSDRKVTHYVTPVDQPGFSVSVKAFSRVLTEPRWSFHCGIIVKGL